ncbi:MAG: pyrroline-5-carboxylate reductase [Flammeovirgaceae bacterium]
MSIKIAIIGGGNLGASIAEGLIKTDLVRPSEIAITRRHPKKIAHLAQKGLIVSSDNLKVSSQAEIVILAVKPYQAKAVLEEISSGLTEQHIITSVVTGFSLEHMQQAIGVEKKLALFRAMPNTAIAIQQSMTCIASNDTTWDKTQKVVNIFDQLGKTVMIDEELMEAATVLGACGIAYALRFIRAASQGGIEIGFGAETANLIAAQTVKGAAALLLENGQHPEHEIDKVTTPQGCTIAGLNEMEHRGFSSALIKGVVTSFKKIDKMKS